MKELIAFKASWCGPCKALAPTLEKMKTDGYNIRVVDVEEDSELASKYGVRAVPTMVLVAGDKLLNTLIGNQPLDNIVKFYNGE